MTRSFRSALLTTSLAFTVFLAACSGGSDNEATPAPAGGDNVGSEASATAASDGASTSDVTVTSDDGALTVTVPAGAGPSDVTITAIEAPAAFADLEGVSVLAAYELGPDGAEFSEPVTIEFHLPEIEGDSGPLPIPMVSTADGAGFELLGSSVVTVHDSGTVVRGTTTHFSTFVLGIQESRVSGVGLSPADLGLAIGASGRFEAVSTACGDCTLRISDAREESPAISLGPHTGDRFSTVMCDASGRGDVDYTIRMEVTLGDALQLFLRGGGPTVVTVALAETGSVSCIESGPTSLPLDALTLLFAERTINGLPTLVDEAHPTVTIDVLEAEAALEGGAVSLSGSFAEPTDGPRSVLLEIELEDGTLAEWWTGPVEQADRSFVIGSTATFFEADGDSALLERFKLLEGLLVDDFRVPLILRGGDGNSFFFAPYKTSDGQPVEVPDAPVSGVFLTFTAGDHGAVYQLDLSALEGLPDAFR